MKREGRGTKTVKEDGERGRCEDRGKGECERKGMEE